MALEQLAPGTAAIAGTVVGQHPLDGDPALGEPAMGSSPEPTGGGGLLVGVDLDIGQPGVVINRGVHIAIAMPGMAAVGAQGCLVGLAVAFAELAAVDAVAAPWGMLPSFLMSTWTRQPGWGCS